MPQSPMASVAAEQVRASSTAAAVAVTGLSKSFDRTPVLHEVGLDVPGGQIVALLGPSGCGKTTLLRCVAGLERPDSGEIRVDGRLLSGPRVFVPSERRRIGMVFQDGALFPHMTVTANVGYGLPRAERRGERVRAALDLVGLAPLAERMPASLSGGQQQRVALARALVTRPAVLLLDEPFSSLDTVLRVQIRAEVRELLTELGATVVFVTHDQEEAFLIGDQVAVMLDGRLVQQATPEELYRRPSSRAVAEFVGDANFLEGVAAGDRVETAAGQVPVAAPLHGQVEVLVRPELLRLEPGQGSVVETVEYYGHDAVYVLRGPRGERVRARVLSLPAFRPGDQVELRYDGGPSVAYPRARG